ncbi:MAG: hypothetical protein AMXMBFR4_26370 [Candidatus Hydrogenedentota bacterium]
MPLAILCCALLTSAANEASPLQYSFTIWDWDTSYRDFARFKRQIDTCVQNGFNMIELGVGWKDCEPEDGRFAFARVDERVEYIESKNLNIRLRVNVTDWPAWYSPELMRGENGPLEESGGFPSIFDGENRHRQAHFVHALVHHYRGRGFTYTPGFGVHMEVKFGGWNSYERSATDCYRRWKDYREELLSGHAQTEKRQAALGDRALPPMLEQTSGRPDVGPSSTDWIRFREWALAEWVRNFAATVRLADDRAGVSVPLGESFRRQSAEFANLAYWVYSRPADEIVHSYDFFWHGPDGLHNVPLAMAIMSGITQKPVVFEIDGPVLLEKFGYKHDDLTAAGRSAIESGAMGVQVTNWGSTDPAAQSWMGELGEWLHTRRANQDPADPPRVLYYVSKWQNYCYRESTEWVHERQFALWHRLHSAGIPTRIVSDENLIHEDLRAEFLLLPFANLIDLPARERIRSLSYGMRVIADEKPGIYTVDEKTEGNFGAKIEILGRPFTDNSLDIPSLFAPPADAPQIVRVAAVQFHTTFDIKTNTDRMVDFLHSAADDGVRVVAFSEMALTGYTKRAGFENSIDWKLVDQCLTRIQTVCKDRGIYAVVGAPKRDGDRVYCAAIVIDPKGDIIDAYEKIYLAGEPWAAPGRTLSTYRVDGATCGTLICHDERYPHLVQLRALAGAQLFFYISCESGLTEEHKIAPYRAQIQARAVENGVFVVHANAPALRENPAAEGTSHGHSRIIAPDGNIIREAGPYDEELVVADIDLRHVRKQGEPRALVEGPTAQWLREGLRHVVGE